MLSINATDWLSSTAKTALCNHVMLLSVRDSLDEESQINQRLQIQCQLEKASHNITQVLIELVRLEQLKYLPNTL